MPICCLVVKAGMFPQEFDPMKVPKTAIIGASGFIGKALLSLHRKTHPDCVGTALNQLKGDLKYLDLLSCDIAPLKLAESGHQDAIITAGIARIIVPQKEKEYTKKVTQGTLKLIQQLADEGIKPIFISSECVFDGRTGNYDDDAPVNPVNEYGKQKAEIEQGMQEICKGRYLIARFSKVFTLEKKDGSIFDEMAAALTSGGTIRAAYDQIFSPTLLSDAINALKILQTKNATGAFNISTTEVWSRYDLALIMADHLGVGHEKVERISLDDLNEVINNEVFTRPKNTSLNVMKLIRETKSAFTPITQCMEIIAKKWTTP